MMQQQQSLNGRGNGNANGNGSGGHGLLFGGGAGGGGAPVAGVLEQLTLYSASAQHTVRLARRGNGGRVGPVALTLPDDAVRATVMAYEGNTAEPLPFRYQRNDAARLVPGNRVVVRRRDVDYEGVLIGGAGASTAGATMSDDGAATVTLRQTDGAVVTVRDFDSITNTSAAAYDVDSDDDGDSDDAAKDAVAAYAPTVTVYGNASRDRSRYNGGGGDAFVTFMTNSLSWRPSYLISLASTNYDAADDDANADESATYIEDVVIVANIDNNGASALAARDVVLVIGQPSQDALTANDGGGHEYQRNAPMMSRSLMSRSSSYGGDGGNNGAAAVEPAGEYARVSLRAATLSRGETSLPYAALPQLTAADQRMLYYCDVQSVGGDGRGPRPARYGFRLLAAPQYMPAGVAVVYDARGNFVGATDVRTTAQGGTLDIVVGRSNLMAYEAVVSRQTINERVNGGGGGGNGGNGNLRTSMERVKIAVQLRNNTGRDAQALLRYYVGDAEWRDTTPQSSLVMAPIKRNGYLEWLVLAPAQGNANSTPTTTSAGQRVTAVTLGADVYE